MKPKKNPKKPKNTRFLLRVFRPELSSNSEKNNFFEFSTIELPRKQNSFEYKKFNQGRN